MKILQEGIRTEKKEYIKCRYSSGAINSQPIGTITVYSDEYGRLPEEIEKTFTVQNDSDSQTDYFCHSYFHVQPNHKLYPYFIKKIEERGEKWRKAKAKRDEKKTKIINKNETINIDGQIWKIIKKTPKAKNGINGYSYELTKLFRPQKTWYAWGSDDNKKYKTPYSISF